MTPGGTEARFRKRKDRGLTELRSDIHDRKRRSPSLKLLKKRGGENEEPQKPTYRRKKSERSESLIGIRSGPNEGEDLSSLGAKGQRIASLAFHTK